MRRRNIPRMGDEARRHFWSLVRRSKGCWLWKRRPTKEGYGNIRVGYGCFPAHRVAYFLATGKQPGRKAVCHDCDVRRCCNPAHLFLGSWRENQLDAVAKKRHAFGERHGNAKVTVKVVRRIRKLYRTGYGTTRLAKKFKLSLAATSNIARGKRWRHVPLAKDK